MPRLPDVRLDDWWADQQQQFREKTEGMMPALEFELQGRMDEAQIPPDYDAPGGMDQWKQAEQSLLERGLAVDQKAEEERRRQEEEQLQEQLRLEQAQAQQKQQDEAHQREMSMLNQARSLGIPTPEDAFKDFQEPGDHTSTTGIFDQSASPPPTPEPLSDVDQFNNHASSMLSDTFGPPPEPDQTQPPSRDDTSSSGILDQIGSAVTSGAQAVRRGADELGTALENNPLYQTVTTPGGLPDVVKLARQADEGAGYLFENYGAEKVARDLDRKRELQREIAQFQPPQSNREAFTEDYREIPDAWARANPEKAAELEELRKSEESLIMGASGTMGAGGAAEEAFGAIKALLAHGLDDAALSAERGMAEKTSMTLAEIQAKTRGIKPAVRAAAEAASTPPDTTPTGFRTAKGSIYELQPDGTTLRNKAARSDPGHEGDFGLKDKSDATYYLAPEVYQRLGFPQGKSRLIDHGDGTLSVSTQNAQGQWGIAPSQRNVPYSTTPEVGAIPLEAWNRESINNLPAYSSVHFGNPIDEVYTAERGAALPTAGVDAAPDESYDRYYHGTNQEFGDIDPAKLGPQGLYITPDPDLAKTFAGEGPDSTVKSLLVPKDLNILRGSLERLPADVQAQVDAMIPNFRGRPLRTPENVVKALTELGYDGVGQRSSTIIFPHAVFRLRPGEAPGAATAVTEAAPAARSAYEAAQDTFPHRVYSPESRGLTPDEARQMGLPGFEEVMPPQGRPGGTNIPGFGNLPRSTDRAEGGIGERGADFIRDVLPPSQRLSAAERDKRSADLLNTTPEKIRALLDQEVDPVQVGVEQGALRRYSNGMIGRFEEAGDELDRLKGELTDALETAGGDLAQVPVPLKNEIARWENEYALRGNTAMEAVHGVTARSRAASKAMNAQKGIFEGRSLVEESQRLHDLGTGLKNAAKTVRQVAGKARKSEDVPDDVFEELTRVEDRLTNAANRKALTRKPGTGVGEEGLAPSGPATPRAPREETMVERMGRLKREQGMLENALTQSHSARMEGPSTTSLPKPEHMVDETARGLISDRLSQVESEINEIRDQYRAQASERIQKALEAKANQEPLTPQELQRIADETVGRSALNRITREESRKAKGLTGDEVGLTRDIQKGISKHYKDAQSAIEKEFEKLFGDNVRLEAKTKLWHDRRVDGILSTEKKATTRREVKNLAEQAQEWAKNLRDDANPNLKPERRAELEDLKKDFDFQEELDAVLGQMKAHSQVGERVANDLGERLGVNLQEDVYNRLFQESRRTSRAVEDASIQSVVDQIRDIQQNRRGPGVHLQIAKLYQELESIGDRGLKRASDLRRHANARGIMKSGLDATGMNTDAIVALLDEVDPNKPESMKKLFALMRTPNWWDIAKELSFVNLLSDPLTHVKNISSTGINIGLRTGFRTPLEYIGSGGQTKGQRAAWEGLAAGFGEGKKLARTTMETGVNPRRIEHALGTGDYSHIGREYIPQMMEERGIVPILPLKVAREFGGQMGENIHKMSTRPLEATDAMLGHMAYTSAVHELAQQHADDLLRSGTTDIPRLSKFSKIPEREQLKQYIIDNIHDFPDIIKKAGGIEEYALFRSKPDKVMGDMLRSISRAKDIQPGDSVGKKLTGMFADFVLPFQNVPYNFTRQGLENVVAPGTQTVRGIGAMARGDRKAQGEHFAKAMQGAVMMGAPIMLAQGDNITGPGPRDPAQRQVWLLQHRPNSWRIPAIPGVSGPGPWISYEGTPFAIPFSIVAGAKEGMEFGKDDPNESDTARLLRGGFGAVGGGIRGALSQSLVEGALRNLEIFNGEATPSDIATAVAGFVSRYSPHPLVGGVALPKIGPVGVPPSGMLSFLARIADSVERDTGKASSLDRVPEVIQNQLEARIPGLRQQLPERRDAYGKIVPRPLGSGALGYLGHAEYENDPITSQLARGDIGIPRVPDALTVDKGKIPLTIREQQRFQELYGRQYRRILEEVGAGKETYTTDDFIYLRDKARQEAQLDLMEEIGNDEIDRRWRYQPPEEVAP